jgi:RES domain
VKLWRVLPWDPQARPEAPGGALWFPRPFQGTGRHDDPARYGCLYVCESPVSAIAEALAPFRGTGELNAELLVRMGRPLALAELELAAERSALTLVDLDDPATLTAEALRPSQVATGRRAATQAYAARLFDAHPEAAGLRWWSTLEASWINVTLFDRAAPRLTVREVRPLDAGDEDVRAAARFLGLA